MPLASGLWPGCLASDLAQVDVVGEFKKGRGSPFFCIFDASFLRVSSNTPI
jgi:hypothetical protein